MQISQELLRRYLNNQCTSEEKEQVEKWLKEEKNNPSALSEKQMIKMEANIWENIKPIVSPNEVTPVTPLYKRTIRYAATVLILFTITLSVYYTYDPSETTPTAEVYQTVQTKRGEKRTVTLSDGSAIRMNYETEIKAPERFESDQRVVYLKGHAHFDVARDPDRPFIVYTENTKTQVLGTSFDINTKTAGETEIIVTSGKVAFSEKDRLANLVTLTENDRAVFNVGKSISTNEVNAQRLTAWRENRLVFDGQTLEKIIAVLEPWYDVKISVQDPNLLNRSFTLAGDNPPLETFLRELCFAGRFQYRMEGNEIILY